MSTYTGLNLGLTAPMPTSKPTFTPRPVPRNPTLAFLLSLFLPGLGQFYCRKNSRAPGHCFSSLIGLSGTILLAPMLPGASGAALGMVWGIVLRVAVVPMRISISSSEAFVMA